MLNHSQLKRFCVRARARVLLFLFSISHFSFGYRLLTAGCSLVIHLCNYKCSTRFHRLFTLYTFASFIHMKFLFCSRAKRVIQVHDVWDISMLLRARGSATIVFLVFILYDTMSQIEKSKLDSFGSAGRVMYSFYFSRLYKFSNETNKIVDNKLYPFMVFHQRKSGK